MVVIYKHILHIQRFVDGKYLVLCHALFVRENNHDMRYARFELEQQLAKPHAPNKRYVSRNVVTMV